MAEAVSVLAAAVQPPESLLTVKFSVSFTAEQHIFAGPLFETRRYPMLSTVLRPNVNPRCQCNDFQEPTCDQPPEQLVRTIPNDFSKVPLFPVDGLLPPPLLYSVLMEEF